MRTIPAFALALTALACGSGGGSSTTTASSASGAAAPASAAASERPLRPGDPAPAVTMKLQDGREVKLADLGGKYVLVYFYPKDDTPGCTAEANGIKNHWQKFKDAGVEVYGISTQGAESHQQFIDKYGLPFPLVVDEDGSIAKAFRVPLKNGMASRQSFLVDKDGKIKQVWLSVNAAEHADDVLAELKVPDADDD